MGTRLRIGVVGLGGIAQKMWLPVLGIAENWALQVAWSPGREKVLRICGTWRTPYADSLDALAAQCDAVFVHTSTASHYEVVNRLLNVRAHICAGKPLVDRLSRTEALVELATRRHLTLMVSFSHRFAPLYRELKGRLGEAALLRMDKHRSDSVGNDLCFTLLDDYLHMVDTVLWLADGQVCPRDGTLQITPQGEVLYVEHQLNSLRLQVTTSMYRRAGSQREWVQAVTDGGLYAVSKMHEWQEECDLGVVQRPVTGWQTTLEQRNFIDCARYFIECVQNQTIPETTGEQALLTQRVVDKLWCNATSE